MFEWFFAPYSRLLHAMESLLRVPGTCAAPVDVLRTRRSVEERVHCPIDYRTGPRRAWLTAACRAQAAAALVWTSLFLWSYQGSDLRVPRPATASDFARTHR